MTVAQVTMVELDEGVMEAVRVFMPSVAEGVLDNYKGERSKVGRGHQALLQIIVGDAVKYLEDSRRQGRQFDYIFGDLTDIPINTDHNCEFPSFGSTLSSPVETTWDFICQILSLSFSCLRPGGKYMTHVSGESELATFWNPLRNRRVIVVSVRFQGRRFLE